jgi:muramoyltetrapeptide carboxypeptidase
MNRKFFLSSVLPFAVVLKGATQQVSSFGEIPSTSDIEGVEESSSAKTPPYLKKGDLIGITAPAGYITLEEIQPAIQLIENWGYKIKIGETIGKKDFTFGGTDAERTDDFQQMLDDPQIKAILCARGGYGIVRIIDYLKWDKFKLKPKWIIGFSDATVFHSHLNRAYNIASIHSKMCNSFPDDWSQAEPIQIETIESIHKSLAGEKMKYTAEPNQQNKQGIAEGALIGGNLKMLETLTGTISDINTTGKILFVEDTGEYMYNVDRMFWNLKRTGKLSQLKGLIIGGFKIKVDEGDEDFGRTLQDIVLEKIKSYKYPVCFDFPVGHQKNNFALKCGVKHKLVVKADEVFLEESH